MNLQKIAVVCFEIVNETDKIWINPATEKINVEGEGILNITVINSFCYVLI